MNVRFLAPMLLLAITGAAWGGGAIPEASRATMEKAGVPVYPGAVYCIGDASVGIRLATSDSEDKVRAWYVEHLSGWALFEDFGSWMLADSPASASMSERMESNVVVVDTNAQLPEWHGLDADMTTQIVISLPGME